MRQRLSYLAAAAAAALAPTAWAQDTAPQFYMEGAPADLACVEGPNAATWAKVKARFRGLFEALPGGALQPAPREWVQDAVSGAIADVQAVNGFDLPGTGGDAECGMGKVLLQLLSIVMIDDPATVAQVFRMSESLTSPVLTLLLDVPWVGIAMSGWPLFGALAQVSFHKVAVAGNGLDSAFIDGITDQGTLQYYAQCAQAQQSGDLPALAVAAATFLNTPATPGNEESVFAQLTAAATQAVAQSDVQKRLDFMRDLQQSMRSVLQDAGGLEVASTSRWPFWSLLHVVADVFV